MSYSQFESAQPDFAPQGPHFPASRSLRILLAEDSLVNQKLASRMLEKQGHLVTIVSTGRAADAALQSQTFDVVLMDVQMPEMDGIEATRCIRSREITSGRHTPIIALTAHAMRGDRERCLEAGMDGYITKPVRTVELFAEIDAVLRTDDAGLQQCGAVDWDAMLERTGGDMELVKELVPLFLDQKVQLIAGLRAGITARDYHVVEHAAHALKGAVSNFTEGGAYESACRLEKMAHAGTLTGAEETLRTLEDELQLLDFALSTIPSANASGSLRQ